MAGWTNNLYITIIACEINHFDLGRGDIKVRVMTRDSD